jgi:hypothetical protein
MDLDTIGSIAEWLKTTGPWGIVAAMGWAYWSSTKTKDREIRALYGQISEMTGLQTQAIIGVRDSINDLREMIGYALLRAKNSKPPQVVKSEETTKS